MSDLAAEADLQWQSEQPIQTSQEIQAAQAAQTAQAAAAAASIDATLVTGVYTQQTADEYAATYASGLATATGVFAVIGGVVGGLVGLLTTLGLGTIATALGGTAAGMEIGADLYKATNMSPEAYAALQNQGPTITGTETIPPEVTSAPVTVTDPTTGATTTTDPATGTTTVADPDGTTVVTTDDGSTTTTDVTGTTVVDAHTGETTHTDPTDTDVHGTTDVAVIDTKTADTNLYTGTVNAIDTTAQTPVVAVGEGKYGPAVSTNLNYSTLSDEEQIRLAIQKGMFAESAGQEILNMKVEEATIEGNIRYKAAARGLRMEGTPTMQLQAQQQTANSAIGFAERQFAGSISGMDWTAQAAIDKAALAQKENIQNINFTEAENQSSAWVGAFSSALSFGKSLLSLYWTPKQGMSS
jgi:hypothetical protein